MKERKEPSPFGVQLSLGGEFFPEISPQNLEFLSCLKPSPKDYQPLVLIMALGEKSSDKIGAVSVLNPPLTLILIPTSGDFTSFVGDMGKKPRGIIIKVDGISEITPNQVELLRGVVDWMKRGRSPWERRIWLAEENPSDLTAEREERMKKLMTEKLGLVGAEVHKDRTTGLVWVTARPRKETERKPVDLLHKRYIPAIKKEVEEALVKSGFRIISTQEINDLLAASTFPPKDLARLRMGWGIWIEGPCGQCVYRIDRWGAITQVFSCGEDHEEEREKIEESIAAQPVVLGYNLPIEGVCWDCGKKLTVTRILGDQNLLTPKQKQQGLVVVLEEVDCVNCGSLYTHNIVYQQTHLRKEELSDSARGLG